MRKSKLFLRRLTPARLLALLVALVIAGLWNVQAPQQRQLPANLQPVTVHDGDTLRLGEQRIRLWGIDAPELAQRCNLDGQSQPCGEQAREALIQLIGKSEVQCTAIDQDRYGRTVARCKVDCKELNRAMVEQGWAMDYLTYSKGEYLAAQRAAAIAKRGIWATNFIPPWQWRTAHSNQLRR